MTKKKYIFKETVKGPKPPESYAYRTSVRDARGAEKQAGEEVRVVEFSHCNKKLSEVALTQTIQNPLETFKAIMDIKKQLGIEQKQRYLEDLQRAFGAAAIEEYIKNPDSQLPQLYGVMLELKEDEHITISKSDQGEPATPEIRKNPPSAGYTSSKDDSKIQLVPDF